MSSHRTKPHAHVRATRSLLLCCLMTLLALLSACGSESKPAPDSIFLGLPELSRNADAWKVEGLFSDSDTDFRLYHVTIKRDSDSSPTLVRQVAELLHQEGTPGAEKGSQRFLKTNAKPFQRLEVEIKELTPSSYLFGVAPSLSKRQEEWTKKAEAELSRN